MKGRNSSSVLLGTTLVERTRTTRNDEIARARFGNPAEEMKRDTLKAADDAEDARLKAVGAELDGDGVVYGQE